MNWGKGLVIAFVCFAALMISFLVRAILSGSESVPKGYYEKGNKYQQTIDEEKAAIQYGTRVDFDPGKTGFVLRHDSMQPDSGRMLLKWPPDETKNIRTAYKLQNGQKEVFLQAAALSGGWMAEVEFYHNGVKYLHRQKVWVP